MTIRVQRVAVVTAAALALGLALTGCGRLGAQSGPAPADSPTTVTTSSAPASPAADDSATIAGITQDLDSADAANSDADSNSRAGDQAAASNDEP